MIYLCHNNITNKIHRAYALWERSRMTGEEWKIVEEDLKIIGNLVKLTHVVTAKLIKSKGDNEWKI